MTTDENQFQHTFNSEAIDIDQEHNDNSNSTTDLNGSDNDATKTLVSY